MSEIEKTVFLIHTFASPSELEREATGVNGKIAGFFLGQDYLTFSKWKGKLKDKFFLVPINYDLESIIQRLRRPFLDLIADFGMRFHSIPWWISRVSERNTAVSSLFLHCCYLHLVREKMARFGKSFFVISESWEVMETIEREFTELGFRINWVSKKSKLLEGLKIWGKNIGKLFMFFFRSFCQVLCSFFYPRIKNEGPFVLIHTYVDEICFGKNHEFNDRYFPGLWEWLINKGFRVSTLPVLFNINRSYFSAWTWFGNSSREFLCKYQFLRLSDYFFSVKMALKSRAIPFEDVIFEGINVSQLFSQEAEKTVFDVLECILYLPLTKRLKEKGFEVSKIILEFENMIPEKLLNVGIRRFFPKCKIIGYQHVALYPNVLCYFVTEKEAKYAPMPDTIVCHGEFFRSMLIKEGVSENRTMMGPSLRFKYLWEFEPLKILNNKNRFDVFIPLPLAISDAVEVIEKVREALKGLDVQVAVKAHPMVGIEKIFESASIRELPPNYFIFNSSMGDLLRQSKILIGLCSSVFFEALAFGVPIMVIGRETSLNWHGPDFFPTGKLFCSPAEIRNEIIRLLSLSDEESAKLKALGRNFVSQCFSPITEEKMKVFSNGFVFEEEKEQKLKIHEKH